MEKNENREYEYGGMIINGFAMIGIVFVLIPLLIAASIWLGYTSCDAAQVLWYVCTGLLSVCFLFGLSGYFTQEPGEARVMIFFGKYVGTCRQVGFFWVNPFLTRRKLSLRLRNMDIEPIKVNDKVGNPVLIGMVLVWKIEDTYRAVFDIDSASLGIGQGGINGQALAKFVRIQSDAALREVAGHFAYDNMDSKSDTDEITLRDGGEATSQLLEDKINERLAMAGMSVVEARLNYLAYAPEIAAVMLRRQQASAIIAAREKIVEGAVSMVDLALRKLQDDKVCAMTEPQKASLASNLMVVLCSDEPAQPVISTTD